MKLLILDDEVQIREGIREGIDWSELGIDEVHTGGDGFTGLREVASFRPDIVLCDVRMPGMDGLTFLQQVRETCPGLRVIMISGYSDFEYLQKAIRYGAEDYELKPVKAASLIATVRKAQDKIMEERSTQATYQKYKRSYDANFLREILAEKITDHSIIQEFLQKKLGGNERTAFCAVAAVDPPALQGSICPADAAELRSALQKHHEEGILQEIQTGVFMMVLPCTASRLYFLQKSAALCSLLREVRKELRQATFCVAITEPRPLHELAASWRKGKEKLLQCRLAGRGTIRLPEAGKNPTALPELQPICDAFRSYDSEKTKTLIRDYCRLAGKAEGMTIAGLRHNAWSSIEQMEEESRAAQTSELTEICEMLQQVICGDDICTLWLRAMELCYEQLRLNCCCRGQYSSYIEKSLGIINRRYREPITAQSVAEDIGISPNYFSAQFKKEVGVSFSHYLNMVRLQEAARLLTTTDLLVQEIAEQTGFPNYMYFSQKFKKEMGSTPVEYRKNRI